MHEKRPLPSPRSLQGPSMVLQTLQSAVPSLFEAVNRAQNAAADFTACVHAPVQPFSAEQHRDSRY